MLSGHTGQAEQHEGPTPIGNNSKGVRPAAVLSAELAEALVMTASQPHFRYPVWLPFPSQVWSPGVRPQETPALQPLFPSLIPGNRPHHS